MWVRCNLNPGHKNVGDCVVRAIAMATNRRWTDVYDDLCAMGRYDYDMLAHALKSLLTAEAMEEAKEMREDYGESHARGRNPMNGRYISREPDPYYPPMHPRSMTYRMVPEDNWNY